MSERIERWVVVDIFGDVEDRAFETEADADYHRATLDAFWPNVYPHSVRRLTELRDGERVVAVGEEAVAKLAKVIAYETYSQVARDETLWENIARAVLTALTEPRP